MPDRADPGSRPPQQEITGMVVLPITVGVANGLDLLQAEEMTMINGAIRRAHNW